MTSTRPPEPVTKAELLAAIVRKQSALRLMDSNLLAEQIELERSGHEPTERIPTPSHEVRARALLNGHGDLVPSASVDGDGARLADVLVERRAIALALETLQTAEVQGAAASLHEWKERGGLDRWRAASRSLADILGAVAVISATRDAVRDEATRAAGGMLVSLPGDTGVRVWTSQAATQLIEAMRRDGVIT